MGWATSQRGTFWHVLPTKVNTLSTLPGCHGSLVRFELDVLTSAWGFSLVPLHLAKLFVGPLCTNHVTHRFGKGITPARYRLTCPTANDILSEGPVDQKKAGLPLPQSLHQLATEPSERIEEAYLGALVRNVSRSCLGFWGC